MFGVKVLIEKLNTLIASGGLTETQLIQAFGAIESLEKQGVSSVLHEGYLPNVVTNKGRFFWLETEQRYVVSNGTKWNDGGFGVIYDILWGWGLNSVGQVGDGTIILRRSPVAVVGGFEDWVDVEGPSGGTHTLGLRANGTAWAWGNNSRGQLGDNTIVSKSSPVSVVGGFTDWITVTCGNSNSYGLRANGTIWGWGENTSGQIGDNTLTRRSSPVSVVGGYTWVDVSAGTNHCLAIRDDGTAWAWGFNSTGQLGDDTIVTKSSPVSVVGGFTDWIRVFAGSRGSAGHCLGLRSNGTLWAWGNNTNGQLGDDTVVSKRSPVSVVGGFTDWIFASAGGYHTIGLRANGTLWSWGSNTIGQLGDGTTVSKRSPVSVVGGFTDWIAVSCGNVHSIGLRANGTLWGWGANSQGQLGDDTTYGNYTSPISIGGGYSDWVSIPRTMGQYNSHAIRAG